MDLTELLARTGGLESMARELGVSEGQVASGAEALLPALLGGLKRQAKAQPGGLDGLGGLLDQLGGGGLLDEVLAPRPTPVERGNDVLGQIFGSRDVSRTVAQDAATRSGLDPALLRKMLPMLAMVVAGLVARQGRGGAASPTAGQGGVGDLIGEMLGGGSGGRGRAGGLGGLASMLDLDGDGNPLDDILRMAGKALR